MWFTSNPSNEHYSFKSNANKRRDLIVLHMDNEAKIQFSACGNIFDYLEEEKKKRRIFSIYSEQSISIWNQLYFKNFTSLAQINEF